MRRVVVTMAALAMTGAVAFAWQVDARETRCPTTMQHDGVSYSSYAVAEEIRGEDGVGVGTERGCGHQGPWSSEIAVSRIAGVDARIALVTPVAARILYVAQGVSLDELPRDLAELVAP